MSEGNQDNPVNQKNEKKFSRRFFLQALGLTAAGAALTYLPNNPEVQAQGGTVPPIETPPPGESNHPDSVAKWIDSINYNYSGLFFSPILAKGYSFETELESVQELEDIFSTWGKTKTIADVTNSSRSLEVPVFNEAMIKLESPITEQLCDPEMVNPFVAFEANNIRYEFQPIANGYKAVETSVVETASESFNKVYDDAQREMPTEVYPYQVQAASNVISELDKEESFDEGVKRVVATIGEGLNRFSKELYPFMRMHYDKNLVHLTTADGQFPYNDDAELVNPEYLTDVLNLPKLYGHSKHALLMQSALKAVFPDGYKGSQLSFKELTNYFQKRSKQIEAGAQLQPEIIAYPYGIQLTPDFDLVSNLFETADVDTQKQILVFSTYNMDGVSRLDKPIPKGLICCTTVRKDENGNLFIPPNRSYIEDDDRMFAFPDQTTAVAMQFGTELVEEDMELYKRYVPTNTAGASLSTLQATAFIGAVTSKLLKDGKSYSEELVINTLKELCPKIKVGEALLRVPDTEKVRIFFGSNNRLPLITNN